MSPPTTARATQPPEFVAHCLDLLAPVGPCVAKRMFGGWGISTGGLTLAIVADLGEGERLWLKADAQAQPAFEAAACPRFTCVVQGKSSSVGHRSMGYCAAPEEAMESPALMRPWATLALGAAVRAQAAKPRPRGGAAPKN